MFDATKLFKDRLTGYVAETSRYLKYIFNGHIAVAMFFLIAALAVYYQQWLETLSADFPSAWIIAGVLGFVASYTPIKTLLLEADLVFLIPAEHKMSTYFKRSLILSYFHQLLFSVFLIAAISPLYFHAYPERGGKIYLVTVAFVLIAKGLNLIASWGTLKQRNKNKRITDHLIRVVLSYFSIYFLIEGKFLFMSIFTVVLVGIVTYEALYKYKKTGVTWDVLVEKDQHQMQSFYRIANLFTDVPHLQKRFKQRRLLVSLLSRVPFEQKRTYDYLYRITFVRSGDYLGMYLRLIVIGGLLIIFVPNAWMKLIFALLFIYMSVFQMMTLYYHYRTTIWIDIYPVDITYRRQALKSWLTKLTLFQTIIFSMIFLAIKLYALAGLMLISGSLLTLAFIKYYVSKKISD